jgi:multiple sugar transport system permease protein
MVAFSAVILLPLVWLARVALTDKLTAYKLPPEWVALRPDNFITIFTEYNFAGYFLNSIVAAVGSTAISCPWQPRWPTFAPSQHRRMPCACSSWRARCCRR